MRALDLDQKGTPTIPKIHVLKPSMRMLSFRTVQLEDKRATKQPDAHYRKPEHMRWAKQVVRDAYGACQRCGRTGTRLYADHIREIKDGGLLYDLNNGQALCGSCHTIKTMKARAERRLYFDRHNTGGQC